MELNELLDQVEEIRKEMGMTQAETAVRLNVSERTFQRWTSNKNDFEPSGKNVVKIFNFLRTYSDKELNEIFGENEELMKR